MFVELVDLNDFKKYYKDKHPNVELILEKNWEGIYAKVNYEGNGPKPEFLLKDFDCRALNGRGIVYLDVIKKDYINSMYEIFQDSYRYGWAENARNKRISDLGKE